MTDNVSRETMEKLQAFEALVLKWNPKINLIARSTTSEIWDRHIVDSMQVYQIAPDFSHWVDIGSGGGFPGIVCSILASEANPDANFALVESDQRKSVFLQTAIRELGLSAKVLAKRVEEIDPLAGDVISARALDDLNGLLAHAHRHLKPEGTALFPKGVRWKKEHEEAQKHWSYQLEPHMSVTMPEAAILKIKDIKRV